MAQPDPRYALTPEDPEKGQLSAWQWLIARDPYLGHPDGTPNLTSISRESGIDMGTLSCLTRDLAELGPKSMPRLTLLAMRTGVSRQEAEKHLYVLLGAPDAEAVAA